MQNIETTVIDSLNIDQPAVENTHRADTSIEKNIPSENMSRKLKKFGALMMAMYVIGQSAYLNHDNIEHLVANSQIENDITPYSPSEEVKELIKESGMTKLGESIFLSTKPEIVLSPVIKEVCSAVGSNIMNVTFGCIVSNRLDGETTTDSKMYILDVKTKWAKSLEVSTAVHELIHKVFESLTAEQKIAIVSGIDVDKILKGEDASLTYYENEIAARILGGYNNLNDDQKLNEFLAHFGTKIEVDDEGLKKFYSLYIKDQKSLADNYQETQRTIDEDQRSAVLETIYHKGDINHSDLDIENKIKKSNEELDSIKLELGALYGRKDVEGSNKLLKVYTDKLNEASELSKNYEKSLAETELKKANEASKTVYDNIINGK